MNLIFEYLKLYLLETVRNVPALFFTLIFPPLIFLLSIQVWGTDPHAQRLAYLTFANYSVQTVCFMLLGMGVSQEKNSNWAQYVRTLPASTNVMIIGRVLHTVVLSFTNILLLTLVATLLFHIQISFGQILEVFLVCALGAVPFALIGIAIGYLANQDSARSIFTILNLLFLFGSFSMSATGIVYKIQNFILSYQWVVLQRSIFETNISPLAPIITLLAYTIIFIFVIYFSIRTLKTR